MAKFCKTDEEDLSEGSHALAIQNFFENEKLSFGFFDPSRPRKENTYYFLKMDRPIFCLTKVK